jgi:hypothetical protein
MSHPWLPTDCKIHHETTHITVNVMAQKAASSLLVDFSSKHLVKPYDEGLVRLKRMQ